MKKHIIITSITLLLVLLLSACSMSDQILAKQMTEKYSDDQNYVTFTGEVIEYEDCYVVIKCEELKNYLHYEDDFCDYLIFWDQIIELSVGDQIEFVTVPFHFYNGHLLPIVEIKKNEITLLSFEDGKDNLINWVNMTFNKQN